MSATGEDVTATERGYIALRDRIAEVLSDHFDPEPVTGREFERAADAVLADLGLRNGDGLTEALPGTGGLCENCHKPMREHGLMANCYPSLGATDG